MLNYSGCKKKHHSFLIHSSVSLNVDLRWYTVCRDTHAICMHPIAEQNQNALRCIENFEESEKCAREKNVLFFADPIA